jgi:hypothetical protein
VEHFVKGDRVKYTQLALERGVAGTRLKKPELRRGTFMEKTPAFSIGVLWDGDKNVQYYHPGFIEKA